MHVLITTSPWLDIITYTWCHHIPQLGVAYHEVSTCAHIHASAMHAGQHCSGHQGLLLQHKLIIKSDKKRQNLAVRLVTFVHTVRLAQ